MNYIERKERLDYLLELIEKERCFGLDHMSNKFNCSKSTIKRMISDLKYEGHQIFFCKTSQTFKKIKKMNMKHETETEMLKHFNFEQLEERLEFKTDGLWGFSGIRMTEQGATKDIISF